MTPNDYNKPIDESNKGDIASMTQGDVDNILNKVVSGLEEHLPIAVGDDVELVECDAISGKILEYTYMLKNQTVAKFDSVAFKKEQKEATIKNLSSNKEVGALLSAGVTYVYIYKDKNQNIFVK